VSSQGSPAKAQVDASVLTVEQIKAACDLMEDLSAILEAEYEALLNKELTRFEQIQADKEAVISRITAINMDIPSHAAGQHAAPLLAVEALQPAWQLLQALGRTAAELQKRNELIIQRKLTIVRDALRSLQMAAHEGAADFYDPRGKLTDRL